MSLASEHPSQAAENCASSSQQRVVRPRRRYRLEIVIESDDEERIMSELQEITCELECHHRGPVVMGGYHASYHYELSEDKAMTGDLYRQKLDEYLEREGEV